MPQSGRTFRIFVSSTFSDLVAERNALQERVFPRLRELAMAHGCRFQAIDLRWGVSEEAALDQQTMRICLTEIERCQRATPRPNFLILLGDRYGWRPLPYAIPAAEFEALLPHLTESERALACWSESQPADAHGWYRRDDNAVPTEYVLLPRLPGSRHAAYTTWQSEVERPLVEALERAALQAGLEEDALVKYTHSATGQEIVRGAMEAEDAPEHVFGFFRAISNLDEAETSARGTAFVESDADLRRRQEGLKARLRERLPGNIHEYAAQWQAGCVSTAHIGTLPETLEGCLKLNKGEIAPATLCEAVWLRLSQMILTETGKIESVDPLQREQKAHNEFGEERARSFVGREESLVRIAEYLSGSGPHPLAVWGESGCGKSALMARAVQQAQSRSGGRVTLVARFVGATPESSDGCALLQSLCRQITRAYHGDEASIPLEYRDLVPELPKRLALATAEEPLLLFLDALDQLSDSDNARSLVWLPAKLPDHVKLVVSTVPGECVEALRGRLPTSSLSNLPALSKLDGERLLQGWLAEVRRVLTGEQRADIMAKFELGGGLPLYLKLAFEEAKHWHAYDGLPALSDRDPGLSQDIPGVIRDLLWRLEQESSHGRVLVSHALGYLAAARNGLSEDELLDVLWQDQDVKGDFFRRAPQSPKDVTSLPVVIWARLYLDLEPYLALRKADGADLMGFYHHQLAEAAQTDCLSKERHAGLAAYFTPQPLYLESGEAAPNLRKLSEMVYQQARAGLAAQVESALLDYSYLRAKLAAHGVQALVEDYALAPAAGVEGEKASSLSLVQGALRLSAHVVGQDASQLPSQLTGRLLGCAGGDIEGLLEDARRQTRGRWLRPLTAGLAVPGGPLIRTLSAHIDGVDAVAVTADGRRAVSGSVDATLKVWDLESGAELATLRGHRYAVSAVAVTPDGRRAVSGSHDDTLKVWDISAALDASLESRAELVTLGGHGGTVMAVAVTPDGRRVVSGSWNHTLTVWDLESGAELATLRGHGDKVDAVALAPDGRRVVSGSWDHTLMVWDLESGRVLRTLRGHSGQVHAVAVTPDGRWAVSGSGDSTLKVWDLESGADLATLRGHTESVEAVAVTPDGRRVVSGSRDDTLKVWDISAALDAGLEGGAELATLRGHSSLVMAVALRPDGRQAVSASLDGTLKVWDVSAALHAGQESWAERAALRGHGGWVNAVAVTAGGRRLVTGSSDNTLKVWNLESGVELSTLRGHDDAVVEVAVSTDGRRAVSGSGDETVKVWDLESGAELRTLRGHRGTVWAVAMTPDGRRAVSASSNHEEMEWDTNDNTLTVWDLESGTPLRTLNGHWDRPRAVAVAPDGRRAVSGSSDNTLKVWDLESGKELVTLLGHRDKVDAVAITPDGRRVVSGSWDNTLKVWDLESGVERATLRGHTGSVLTVAVMPDGRRAVSASSDKTLKVWDLESGEALATFCDEGGLRECAAGPDGATILAGAASGQVHYLRLEGVIPGLAVVTAWRERQTDVQQIPRRAAAPRWQFWRQQPVFEAVEVIRSCSLAFGCPHCRTWSEIADVALGTAQSCPHCGRMVRLNPFVVEADWRPVVAAWWGEA